MAGSMPWDSSFARIREPMPPVLLESQAESAAAMTGFCAAVKVTAVVALSVSAAGAEYRTVAGSNGSEPCWTANPAARSCCRSRSNWRATVRGAPS
ncbi:hypothetical protein HEMA109418_09335 [Helcobacillus massiliensis]